MDEWLLKIISDIERERKEAKFVPFCATFTEIMDRCSPEEREYVRDALNRLYVGGLIRVWNGINDTIIQTVK